MWWRRCRCPASTTRPWTATPSSPKISPGRATNSPVLLPVAEDIPAGRTDLLTLKPGTAHRIMTGAPVPSGATAVVPVEATDGATDTVAIRATAKDRTAHPPRRRGRHRGHHRAAGRAGRHTRGARSRRGTGSRRADSRSAATGSGDVDRLGAGGARHAAEARSDLRVECVHARRGRPRCGRRGGRIADDR